MVDGLQRYGGEFIPRGGTLDLITSIRFHDDSIPQQHSRALNVYQLVGTNIRFITTCSLVLISQEDVVLLMVLRENHDHLNGTN